jgi:predicted outer membrane protein
MALAHSPSSSTLAMAQQTKDDHERLEKRVVATAEKLDIKLEEYSPATYEVAVTNELLANRGNFEASLVMAMSRSRAEAEHGLTVAQTETLRDRDLVELIKEEKPLLAANHVTPASYRNESVAREGEVELGQ